MGRLNSESAFVAVGGATVIAVVTALLRVWWVWWGPGVVMSSDGGLRGRSLVLLLAGLLSPLAVMGRRRQWSYVAAAVGGVLIGFAIGTALAKDGGSPRASSREYAMMTYLVGVAGPTIAASEFTGGLMGTTIAVVDEAGVNGAAMEVRRAICEGYKDDFLTHIITVGGPDTAVMGRALQKAVRWLPKYTGSELEIVIVTPAPVADNVRQALQEKGLRLREMEHQFPEPLP